MQIILSHVFGFFLTEINRKKRTHDTTHQQQQINQQNAIERVR